MKNTGINGGTLFTLLFIYSPLCGKVALSHLLAARFDSCDSSRQNLTTEGALSGVPPSYSSLPRPEFLSRWARPRVRCHRPISSSQMPGTVKALGTDNSH